jgi:hypothetical protein
MSCGVSQLEFSIHTKLLFVNEHKMTIYVPFGFNLFSNIWINIFHWWNKRKPKYPHFLAVWHILLSNILFNKEEICYQRKTFIPDFTIGSCYNFAPKGCCCMGFRNNTLNQILGQGPSKEHYNYVFYRFQIRKAFNVVPQWVLY